jgi:hypothetical protein
MDLTRLEQILDRASSQRITVIGDLMLDEFVWGKVGRISPEAPVPVVEVTGESFYPGGAANVARNLREFVDRVAIIGLLGKDRSGQQLRELLSEQNIDTSDTVDRRHILKGSLPPSEKIFRRPTQLFSKTTAKASCRPNWCRKSQTLRGRPARSSLRTPILVTWFNGAA